MARHDAELPTVLAFLLCQAALLHNVAVCDRETANATATEPNGGNCKARLKERGLANKNVEVARFDKDAKLLTSKNSFAYEKCDDPLCYYEAALYAYIENTQIRRACMETCPDACLVLVSDYIRKTRITKKFDRSLSHKNDIWDVIIEWHNHKANAFKTSLQEMAVLVKTLYIEKNSVNKGATLEENLEDTLFEEIVQKELHSKLPSVAIKPGDWVKIESLGGIKGKVEHWEAEDYIQEAERKFTVSYYMEDNKYKRGKFDATELKPEPSLYDESYKYTKENLCYSDSRESWPWSQIQLKCTQKYDKEFIRHTTNYNEWFSDIRTQHLTTHRCCLCVSTGNVWKWKVVSSTLGECDECGLRTNRYIKDADRWFVSAGGTEDENGCLEAMGLKGCNGMAVPMFERCLDPPRNALVQKTWLISDHAVNINVNRTIKRHGKSYEQNALLDRASNGDEQKSLSALDASVSRKELSRVPTWNPVKLLSLGVCVADRQLSFWGSVGVEELRTKRQKRLSPVSAAMLSSVYVLRLITYPMCLISEYILWRVGDVLEVGVDGIAIVLNAGFSTRGWEPDRAPFGGKKQWFRQSFPRI